MPIRVLLLTILYPASAVSLLGQDPNGGSSSTPHAPALAGSDTSSADEGQGDQGQADPESMFPHLQDTRFWLSGQANFIFQAHPNFHAPYSGKNSLSPDYEKATSRVLTLYTGVRLTIPPSCWWISKKPAARR